MNQGDASPTNRHDRNRSCDAADPDEHGHRILPGPVVRKARHADLVAHSGVKVTVTCR
jgi:hypothetical protein